MIEPLNSSFRTAPSVPLARSEAIPPSADAEAAAKQFEAMFLTQSFEQSFKTLPDSAFGGGHAGETWRHFLAKAIADEVASGGGTGIAAWLAPQIAQAQQDPISREGKDP